MRHHYLFSALLTLFFSPSILAQYCTSVGPSQVADSNVQAATLLGDASTFISYSGCPGIVGLEDLTSQSVSLSASSSYTLNVQFGTCGGNYAGAGQAWIDFNNNGTFEMTEALGSWSGTPPTALSAFNFSVPANCVNGATRMRIMQWEGGALPLNPCGSFTWGSVVDFTVVLSGGSGGSGGPTYCTAVGPSSAADSNLGLLNLSGEAGTAINFIGCPGVVGLDNQTALQSVMLGKGNTYNATLEFGTCGGSYPGVGEAWIDFDQSGTFDPGESIGQWTGNPPATTIFNFTVPLGATDGTTRMRVVHFEGGTLPIDPCATFTWGSTTDFEVIIGAGVDCSGYIGDDMNDPRIVTSLPYSETHSNSVCYTNNVPVYSSPDVFYRLIPANYGVAELNISLCGSLFDTYLAVMDTGGNILAYNDDYGPCSPQSELTIPANLGDTLYIVVQGWGTEKGDYTIAINDAALAGISDDENKWNFYPNPTKGTIVINGISDESLLTVFDPEGREVMELRIVDNQPVDLSSLSPGLYFIRLNNELTLNKLIIE